MKYFTNCKTIEEAKKLYRRLAMENHPDRGGDLDTMKAINAEYDEFFNTFKAQHNAAAKTTGARPINETPEEFRQVIDKIINIPGIIIELCGSWIWISGETRAFKDQIKAAGCFWANKKKCGIGEPLKMPYTAAAQNLWMRSALNTVLKEFIVMAGTPICSPSDDGQPVTGRNPERGHGKP